MPKPSLKGYGGSKKNDVAVADQVMYERFGELRLYVLGNLKAYRQTKPALQIKRLGKLLDAENACLYLKLCQVSPWTVDTGDLWRAAFLEHSKPSPVPAADVEHRIQPKERMQNRSNALRGRRC